MPKCHVFPFFAARHFRIPLVITILGGARRLNEAGINNASFGEHQSGSGDAGVDSFKDLLAEVVLLEQMTELVLEDTIY